MTDEPHRTLFPHEFVFLSFVFSFQGKRSDCYRVRRPAGKQESLPSIVKRSQENVAEGYKLLRTGSRNVDARRLCLNPRSSV